MTSGRRQERKGRVVKLPPVPEPRIQDAESWETLQFLDEHGVNLSQWEIDYVEDLTKLLKIGGTLSPAQKQKLVQITSKRVP